jgi:NADH:ubiquinone oxidoreductase subunit C
MRALRDNHGYRFYICATATDRDETLELIHGVRNLETNDDVWIKVKLPKDGADVESIAFLFAGAEWHEREMLDLFGIGYLHRGVEKLSETLAYDQLAPVFERNDYLGPTANSLGFVVTVERHGGFEVPRRGAWLHWRLPAKRPHSTGRAT